MPSFHWPRFHWLRTTRAALAFCLGVVAAAAVPASELFVSDFNNDNVLVYDGETGAFKGVFASGGGLNAPSGMTFGPDGHLYVASAFSDQVLRYHRTTGAFIDAFVPAGSGGLDFPTQVVFRGGSLFVSSSPEVLRYDGFTGAFTEVFASGNGLIASMKFGPDGNSLRC